MGTQNVQCMLVQAMSDWYMQGDSPDHNKLMRILDVAQDLKVQIVTACTMYCT